MHLRLPTAAGSEATILASSNGKRSDTESSDFDAQALGVISFLTNLGDQLGPWLYLLVAGLAFGGSAFFIGMVLPGETALLIGGSFRHQGLLSLPVMLAVAVTAHGARTRLHSRFAAVREHAAFP